MKMRLGGVLAIALGTVLIVNGVSQSGDGTVGALPRQCGAGQVGISQSNQCPVGGITITDTTPAAPGLPADFDVTITSTNCLGTDGQPVNRTLTVPIGASATTGESQLYVYTSLGSTENGPKCAYTLTREDDPDYTATFTPASPVTIPFSNNDRNNSQRVAQVTLLNEAAVDESSAPPSGSVPASESAPASETVEPSESGPQTDFTDTAAGSASASAVDAGSAGGGQGAAPIAETGPSQSITASLWLGVGLLFLGLFLLFEGRIRKLGKHRS